MLLFLLLATSTVDFEDHFTGACVRFDYHHSGNATEEHIAPTGFRLEGEWPGSRTALVDESNLGKYRFRMLDPETGSTLYSRGFASIYGEWETTGEAKRIWGSFEESWRFPEPKAPVRIELEKRQADGEFAAIYSTDLNPGSRFVDRSAVAPVGETWSWLDNGPAADKVDLLIVAEGYPAAQRDKFQGDVDRLAGVLFDTDPFKRRRSDFNVRLLFVPTERPGISNPRSGVWRDSAFGLSFNAFDSDRYVLTFQDRILREAAAQVPYDAVILLFNDRKYGGGGIYNLWSTCAADSKPAPYLIVHEFGHSFAGLADEYYTSQVSYEDFTTSGVEPWEPNVTALLDPSSLKWRDLVEAGTPLPTPWNQEAYDKASYAYQEKRARMRSEGASEEVMEALFDEVKATTEPMLRGEEHFGKVGAFEGAAYQAKGLFRSEADCIMFTRNPTTFCRVCSRAIEAVIDSHTR